MNRCDVDGIAAAFHPDFEMIVPQHPARGFKAVVMFEIDAETDTMRVVHYFSDEVNPGGPATDGWMHALGSHR